MIIGIVGKANVGKSTFFKALTLAEVLIANYPFATVEPNKGFGFVKVKCVDKELNVECKPKFGYCHKNIRFVPVELIDVAGLVPGAHEGKGMGNKFLDDLRQADALIHIVDMSGSTNEKGEPIKAGTYDPAFDIKFLEFELDMWYLSILKKGWERFARQVKQEHSEIAKAIAKQLSGLNVTEDMAVDAIKEIGLNTENPVEWKEEELLKLAQIFRKKTKPMLIAANKIDINGAQENLEKVRKQFPDLKILPCSSESELALKEAAKKELIDYLPGEKEFKILKDLPDAQKKALEFMQKDILGKLGSTGVQQVIDFAVFELLGFFAVFPVAKSNLTDQFGNVLPDCLLIPPESTALDCAEKIHTDIAERFIGAMDIKTKRKIGKETKLNHRDVIEVLTK